LPEPQQTQLLFQKLIDWFCLPPGPDSGQAGLEPRLKWRCHPHFPFFYIACGETITGAIKPTNMTEEDLKAIAQNIVGVKVLAEMNNPICWK